MRIAIISPFPPSVGGMAVLAESLSKALTEAGNEVLPLNTHPVVSNFLGIKYLKKLWQWLRFLLSLKELKSCEVALMVTSSGDYFNSKIIPALYICRLLKCRVVLDFVGGGILEFQERERRRIIIKLKKFEHILVPSTPFKIFFEEAGLKCTLFPHIVEIEKFHSVGKDLKEPIFLSAKNLMEYSNVGSIIRAFAIVQRRIPEAKLFITGNGPQKRILKDLVSEMNLRNVTFFEGLTNDQMPGIYSRATIFLHATRLESFGIAIVEALASGTPVISSNVGGIPDIIKDGTNGFLVDYNDHEKMAERIFTLLENKDLYNKFISEGLKTANSYSSKALTPKLMEFIDSIK
jgi:glycosyltransferase involved in cell wall biosynthesis